MSFSRSLKQKAIKVWEDGYNHPFVQELGAGTLENNFYKSWIDTYSGVEFEESFEWFYDALDELVKNKTETEKKVVEDIFISSVEFEYMFWDMAYNKHMSYVKNH